MLPPPDARTAFLFEDLAIRGEIVQLHDVCASVLGKHAYPASVQRQLGEALAAAALLTGTLKFEGLLVLQAKGSGPLTLLMAECSHDGKLRAIARYEGKMPEEAPLVSLLGAHDGTGHLAITIDPVQGQRYQGIVPLDGLSLGECIEHYFSQSEQLGTRLWLVAGENRAAGILLQELPSTAGGVQDPDAWNRLCRLTDTLTPGELLELPVETLLQRLYHEEDVRLFNAESLVFACSCSTDRVLAALGSLGAPELRSILAEQGHIEVTCEFCNERRRFGPPELGHLL